MLLQDSATMRKIAHFFGNAWPSSLHSFTCGTLPKNQVGSVPIEKNSGTGGFQKEAPDISPYFPMATKAIRINASTIIPATTPARRKSAPRPRIAGGIAVAGSITITSVLRATRNSLTGRQSWKPSRQKRSVGVISPAKTFAECLLLEFSNHRAFACYVESHSRSEFAGILLEKASKIPLSLIHI